LWMRRGPQEADHQLPEGGQEMDAMAENHPSMGLVRAGSIPIDIREVAVPVLIPRTI
jgi:hypothetical protein